MDTTKHITRYFRQTLIDMDRVSPEDRPVLTSLDVERRGRMKTPYIALEPSAWFSGSVPTHLAESVLDRKSRPGEPPRQSTELMLFPRVDHLKHQGGAQDRRRRQVLVPLGVRVRLDRSGGLRPTELVPWIPREWLDPSERITATIGTLSEVDEFLDLHPFEGGLSWSDLVTYCTRLLCWVSGTEYVEADGDTPETSLFDVPLHEDYRSLNRGVLEQDDPPPSAKDSILKVLNALEDEPSVPILYRRFVGLNSPELAHAADEEADDLEFDSMSAVRHVGQMSGEFPLSPKQRNALHHFLKQKDGDILAVNGPPGTGKTTLLRSVVANMWTQAALDESEPPLIVATSNNNQAVTNILDSFAKVNEDDIDPLLAGRWLPEVDSYGLYLCSSGLASDRNPHQYSGPDDAGAMQGWQQKAFLEEARSAFLIKAACWQGSPVADLESAQQLLHKALQATRREMESGVRLAEVWRDVEAEVNLAHGDIDSLSGAIGSLRAQVKAEGVVQAQWRTRLDKVYQLWESRSLWVRLLSLLPFVGASIRAEEHRRTARLLNQWEMDFGDVSDATVEAWFKNQIQAVRSRLDALANELEPLVELEQRYRSAEVRFEAWARQHGEEHVIQQDGHLAEAINDQVLRVRLFKLATHYWEARWLIELDAFITAGDEDKKSPYKLLRKMRRYAKLTPCFVSTFYMTPTRFTAWERRDDGWQDVPLFGEIDLLIVDEAGQAIPAIASASVALAKRALIVGDVDQIEPVWNLPQSVDRADLRMNDLLDGDSEPKGYEFWLNSGLLTSSGNVMRVAQRQCRYHQLRQLQRGLYLTEHRRCLNPIIEYCNELVYQGVLEPLRGSAKTPVPWGELSLIPVESPSRAYGTSRGNPGEAAQIAAWLMAERQRIVEYAREGDASLDDLTEVEVLNRSVGLVTPFSRQATLIRAELKKLGIDGLTVGTVHSLQGAERLLVLFSSVYGYEDAKSGKFYDRGHNMLNVAVSRAQDAFVVFGHPEVFGVQNSETPSGLLRKRLVLNDDDIL